MAGVLVAFAGLVAAHRDRRVHPFSRVLPVACAVSAHVLGFRRLGLEPAGGIDAQLYCARRGMGLAGSSSHPESGLMRYFQDRHDRYAA